MYIQDYVYEKYLGYLVKEGTVDRAGDKFVFRCFICGDSKTDTSKKRGALIYDEEKATICCFNCGARENFIKYLLRHHRDLFVELVSDVRGMTHRPSARKKKYKNTELKTKEEFKSIHDGSDSQVRKICLDIISNRKIPFSMSQGLRYADEGIFANRLIIPYYRKNGTFEYVSARDITGRDPEKYKTPYNMDRPIYNIDFIDDNYIKLAMEGEIDSSFMYNSVGFGSNTILEKLLTTNEEIASRFNPYNTIIVPDNDKPGIKTTIALMRRGYRAMRWKTRAYKDVNDAVMAGFFIIDESGRIPLKNIKEYIMEPSAFNIYAMEKLYEALGGDDKNGNMGGR